MERYLLRREIARFFTKNEEVRRIVVGCRDANKISVTKQNGGYVICNEAGAHFTHDYRKTEAMINAFLHKHMEFLPIAVTDDSGAIRLINLLEFAPK